MTRSVQSQVLLAGISCVFNWSPNTELGVKTLSHGQSRKDFLAANLDFRINFIQIITEGHLCLRREDSLKEKHNTKYYTIYFSLIFRVCK